MTDNEIAALDEIIRKLNNDNIHFSHSYYFVDILSCKLYIDIGVGRRKSNFTNKLEIKKILERYHIMKYWRII